MAYNSFPYSDYHELNLDYLLNKAKVIEENVADSERSAVLAGQKAALAYQQASASAQSAQASANSAAASAQSAQASETSATQARAAAGDPKTFTAAAQLTDPEKIYVYVGGTTATYTYGHFYYYSGGVWHDGGVYGTWTTDGTLSPTSTNAVQNKVLKGNFDTLDSAVDLIVKGTTTYNSYVQGYRTQADYYNVHDQSTRCTSADVYHVYAGDTVTISNIAAGTKCAILATPPNYDSGWKTADFTYTATADQIVFVECAASDHTADVLPSAITTVLTIVDQASRVTENAEDISSLKSDFDNLSETVNGETVYNYTDGKTITESGEAIDATGISLSDYIPVTWTWDASTYNRFYYSDITPDPNVGSYRIVFFDADKNLLGYRGSAPSGLYRAVQGFANLAYVRFSFKQGFVGMITNSANPPSITHWEATSIVLSNGIVGSLGNIDNLETTDKSSIVSAINEVNAKTGDSLTTSYLDYSMINRLNPTTCEINTRIDVNTGESYAYNNYYTTDYIEIRPGETLYFYRKDTVAKIGIRYFTAYDKDKTVIPSAGSTSEVQSITQSGSVAYVRCSFPYVAGDAYRDPYSVGCMSNPAPNYVTGYGGNPVFKSEYIREIVRVFTSDTEAQVINKFVHAFLTGNCDVVFERGDYSFGTELVKVNSDYGMPHNEIPIGNGCRYFFNGSFLTAVIDLAHLTPESGDDEFYCNFFGCQRRPSNYEMYDGVLSATDTRYVVHDESSGMSGTYRHVYRNMEMHYHTVDRQETIRKCIGGGTGFNGVVEIIGCLFTTDGTSNCVSFHGNGTDVVGAKFDINVRNNWFSNSLRVNQMSTNQTARIFYTGNSATDDPTIDANCTLTSFLNEVRS